MANKKQMTTLGELEGLQRELRLMESSRKAFSEETHLILRRQQQAIEKTKNENELMKADIAKCMRSMVSPLSKSYHQHHIDRLIAEKENLAACIEKEKNSIRIMKEHTAILQTKVLHERKKAGGINATRENEHMVQKQMRILEDRIDQAVVKYNHVLAQNRNRRQSIDDLKKEHLVFKQLQNKIEKDLNEKKKQMAEIIEKTNLTYERRDTAQKEIAAIKETNTKEVERFELERNEFDNFIEEENVQYYQQDASTIPQEGEQGNDNESFQSESQVQEIINKVNLYEEGFTKITEATGISDLQQFVRFFLENEEHNFSLFNFANEQSNEIEMLQEKKNSCKEELEDCSRRKQENQKNNVALEDVENRIQTATLQLAEAESRLNESKNTMEDLKYGVEQLINTTDKRHPDISEPEITVTDVNILQNLGNIEQEIDKILSLYHTMKKKKDSCDYNLNGSDKNHFDRILSRSSSDAILPKMSDYSSDESIENEPITRPLTRDQIARKTIASMTNTKQKRTPWY